MCRRVHVCNCGESIPPVLYLTQTVMPLRVVDLRRHNGKGVRVAVCLWLPSTGLLAQPAHRLWLTVLVGYGAKSGSTVGQT